MNDSLDIYERTPERAEFPERRAERSFVIPNVTIGGLLIKGVIDTGATKTIIKCSLPDFILSVLEAPSISTTILMANLMGPYVTVIANSLSRIL